MEIEMRLDEFIICLTNNNKKSVYINKKMEEIYFLHFSHQGGINVIKTQYKYICSLDYIKTEELINDINIKKRREKILKLKSIWHTK